MRITSEIQKGVFEGGKEPSISGGSGEEDSAERDIGEDFRMGGGICSILFGRLERGERQRAGGREKGSPRGKGEGGDHCFIL